MSAPRRVVLLGMMGAGKTTTGSALADRLGWKLSDSDHDIEARTGTSGAVLAARDGVAALHDLEAQVLLDALDATEPSVVTAAASVVAAPRCRAALSRADLVVWLEAPVAELHRRRHADDHRRTFPPAAELAAMERRQQHFAEVADLRLDATQPTDVLVEAIVAELEHRGSPSVTPRR